MGKIYEISQEESAEIKAYRKNVNDKYTDRRMYAVQLRGDRSLKKIKQVVEEKRSFQQFNDWKKIRLMFQDEAGFGRINKPKYCWCKKGIRPTVPCHYIREYRYVYGAIEPQTGDGFFLVMPYCNTDCMNLFLQELSKKYADDFIVLVCDGAKWHKSNTLQIPENIKLVFIPPYTPEMNPIEQIWDEIREKGFKNEVFQILDNVVERLSDVICNLTANTIKSITGRQWILSI